MPIRRNLSYDVVRTVAIAMVGMVHVTSLLVTQYETAHDATYAVANICNALGRAGAPHVPDADRSAAAG